MLIRSGSVPGPRQRVDDVGPDPGILLQRLSGKRSSAQSPVASGEKGGHGFKPLHTIGAGEQRPSSAQSLEARGGSGGSWFEPSQL